MNELQQQLVDHLVAQNAIDSTPGIPLCCEKHKQFAWWQIELLFADLHNDLEYGKLLGEEQCLN